MLLAHLPLKSQVCINELLAANASVNYETDNYNFVPWVELYNYTDSTVKLKSWYLSDRALIPDKWKIPDTAIPAKSFIIIWVDDTGLKFHASFNLSSKGEFIGIFNTTKQPIDSLTFPRQYPNVSYGRSPDSSATWKFFGKPTPAAANTSPAALQKAGNAYFSVKGGFYNTPFTLSLSTVSPTAKIYYNLNGNEPDEKSTLYTSPVSITKTTIIRTRVFDSSYIPGDIVTHSYFIGENPTIPIASVIAPNNFLWDNTIGMYTVGTNGGSGWGAANYNRDWERAANIEFFMPGDTAAFNTYCGIQIAGSGTRDFAQKSLDVKLRDKYGRDKVKYRLFPNRPYDNIHTFMLRNSGNDWQDNTTNGYGILFRDGMIQSLCRNQMDVDYSSYRPCILFLNGQFWGVSDLREKGDEYYCNNMYAAVDKDSITILKTTFNWPTPDVEGDSSEIAPLRNFILTHDMSVDSNFQKAADSIDLREFINYLIVETFSCNLDWPRNNVKLWRQKGITKWRWMLYDLDFGFNGAGFVTDDMFGRLNNGLYVGEFLYRLMANEHFFADFIQTYAAHLNTTYLPKRVTHIYDSLAASVKTQVERHSTKWKSSGSVQSLASWTTHSNYTRAFGSQRPAAQWSFLKKATGLNNMATVRIRKSCPEMGAVYIHGATLYDSVMTGPYFNHYPLELKAVPANGYYFIWWEVTKNGVMSHVKTKDLYDTLNAASITDSIFYTAIFRSSPTDTFPAPPVIIPPSSIPGSLSDSDWSIYPNPAEDVITIDNLNDAEAELSIVDITGHELYSDRIIGSEMLSVQNLTPGVYVVRICTKDKIIVRKFIKQ